MCDVVTTCGCFLIYLDNILICHPTGHKSNIWGIPKGICEYNETPEDAMFREVYEETNIVIADYKHKCVDLGCVSYNNKKKKLHGFLVVLDEWDYHDIFCSSTFINEYGIIRPEIDAFVWLPINKGIEVCHYTQKMLWNKNKKMIENIL